MSRSDKDPTILIDTQDVWVRFIEDNRRLLLQFGEAYFGRAQYEDKEMISDFFAHVLPVVVRYMNRHKGASITTVATWYLQKRIKKLKNARIFFPVGQPSEGVSHNDKAADVSERPSEDIVSISQGSDRESRASSIATLESDQDDISYCIDLPSFAGRCNAKTLRRLAELNRGVFAVAPVVKRTKSGELRTTTTKYSEKSVNALSKMISVVTCSGAEVYIGSCLNGHYHRVMVAATTDEEARGRLRNYGDILSVRKWNAQSQIGG